MSRRLSPVFALGLLCFGLGAVLPTRAAQAQALSMNYDSEYGPVRLEFDLGGQQVFGDYPNFDGRLIGEVALDPLTITAMWLQPTGERPCTEIRNGTPHWGYVIFTEHGAEPGQMLGRWNYCNEPPTRPWDLNRAD